MEEEEQRHMEDIFGSSASEDFNNNNEMEDLGEEQEKIAEETKIAATLEEAQGSTEMIAENRQKSSRRRRKEEPKRPSPVSSEVTEKIMEARRDFDEALEKIKSYGNRRRRNPAVGHIDGDIGSEPVDLDDIALNFCRQMMGASEADADAIEAGRPALEKQKMLPAVQSMLMRRHMYEVLLDNGVLEAMRRWLEPLPNRQMPAPNIRKTLFELLKGLPIETVHLRESGIGKIVFFSSQRSHELPDIRRLANDLVASWSRPILASHHITNPDMRMPKGKVLQSESLRRISSSGEIGESFFAANHSPHRKLVAHLQKKKQPQSKIR